jgi:hypothetical protein
MNFESTGFKDLNLKELYTSTVLNLSQLNCPLVEDVLKI